MNARGPRESLAEMNGTESNYLRQSYRQAKSNKLNFTNSLQMNHTKIQTHHSHALSPSSIRGQLGFRNNHGNG